MQSHPKLFKSSSVIVCVLWNRLENRIAVLTRLKAILLAFRRQTKTLPDQQCALNSDALWVFEAELGELCACFPSSFVNRKWYMLLHLLESFRPFWILLEPVAHWIRSKLGELSLNWSNLIGQLQGQKQLEVWISNQKILAKQLELWNSMRISILNSKSQSSNRNF